MTGGVEMLSVEEAIAAVLDRSRPLDPIRLPLLEALGAALAEDVASDLDLPPFDKALVDGYAIASESLAASTGRFVLVDRILAGGRPTKPLSPGEAAEIATGAPLPPGSDSVVMVERSRILELDPIQVELTGPVEPGQNRLTRGRELRAGQIVARRGDRLNPARLGVLAAVGRATVLVGRRPRVVVVPTGDEVVAPGITPGPSQIRDSNATTLAALIRASSHDARPGAIARDDLGELTARFSEAVGEGSEAVDVLVVCGGVSAGPVDLVPEALGASGVSKVFHKVRVKPGKPLFFGIGPKRPGRPPALVFGLPGNPVSGLVGTLLFVVPALEALAGLPSEPARTIPIPLAAPYRHRGERATYHPARLLGRGPADWRLDPLPWAGSPDLLAVSKAGGFAAFPAGDHDYEAGTSIPFLPLPMTPRPRQSPSDFEAEATPETRMEP